MITIPKISEEKKIALKGGLKMSFSTPLDFSFYCNGLLFRCILRLDASKTDLCYSLYYVGRLDTIIDTLYLDTKGDMTFYSEKSFTYAYRYDYSFLGHTFDIDAETIIQSAQEAFMKHVLQTDVFRWRKIEL